MDVKYGFPCLSPKDIDLCVWWSAENWDQAHLVMLLGFLRTVSLQI